MILEQFDKYEAEELRLSDIISGFINPDDDDVAPTATNVGSELADSKNDDDDDDNISVGSVKSLGSFFSFGSKKKKKTKLHSHKLVTDSMKNQVFVMTAIMVFSGYIGFGIGNGNKTKARLEKKSLKTDYELTFRGGETKNVHLIGSNSGFVFYVEEDATVVSISPFQENISVLKKLILDEKETE
jgi:hypothetical protein